MKKAIALTLIILSAAAICGADDKSKSESKVVEKKGDKEHIYKAGYDEVWSACMAAAKEQFTIDTIDKENGLITGKSGMSAASNGMKIGIALNKQDDGRVRVKLTTQKKQLVAWGAGGRIADKYFKFVDDAIEKNAK